MRGGIEGSGEDSAYYEQKRVGWVEVRNPTLSVYKQKRVGWVEVRNPTLSALLGFTYVQPNLQRFAIAWYNQPSKQKQLELKDNTNHGLFLV